MTVRELIQRLKNVGAVHGFDLEVSPGYSDYPPGYASLSDVRVTTSGDEKKTFVELGWGDRLTRG